MSVRPSLCQTVLDAPDVRKLAEFYRQLLGLVYREGDKPPTDGSTDDLDWLVLRTPQGGRALAFQQADELTPTTWPSPQVPMQLHLDMTVPDVDALTAQLAAADLSVVNLETAVTTRGTPQAKEFTFRAPPAAFQALKGAGVDVVTMANNHALDYGPAGLSDTLAAAQQAGMPVVGLGADDQQAFAAFVTEVKGSRIAVLGATAVLDDRLVSSWSAAPGHPGVATALDGKNAALVAAVKSARSQADTVVVSDDPSSTLRAWVGPNPTDFGLDDSEASALGVQEVQHDRFDSALVRAVHGTGAHLLVVPGPHAIAEDGIGALLRYDS